MAVNRVQLLLLSLTCLSLTARSAHAPNEEERTRREAREWAVTSILTFPYLTLSRNEEFEGFIPDMLKLIGEKLKQKFRIHEVRDGRYGSYVEMTREWNGMIGEVISGRADLAAAPLTVTDARKEVVDFTTPFMSFPTVILIRKPSSQSSHYHSVASLLNQPDIRYGVVAHGATMNLILSSPDPIIERLKGRLVPTNSVSEGVEKVMQDNEGRFGFIMEEDMAEYYRAHSMSCDLIQISINELELRHFALAFRKGSPDVARVNEAIEEMKRSREMERLRKKWWTGPCTTV